MSLSRAITRIVNGALAPLGIEVRRRFTGERRRPTLRTALERLKALGFTPATVFDVGVADGTSALYETFPTSHHILIEPLHEFTAELDRIAARLAHAEYILAAASSGVDTVVLNIGTALHVTSRHRISDRRFATDEQRTVPAITLDGVWRARSLEAPVLIKIDVEGDELEVLRGAEAVMKCCEYLVIEVAVRTVFAGSPRFEDVIPYLTERGFLLDDILEPAYGPAGNLQMVDLAFVPGHGRVRRLTERTQT